MWSTYGTLELAQINLQAVDMMQNPLLWLPGLVGFALLAGAIPLHGAAGSRRGQRAGRRAVFHGGDEGWSVRHADRFAGRRRAAVVGVMLLALGMITAFIGGLYALMEHNIQRLLAITPRRISALSCWGWAPSSPAWRPATAR